MTEFLCDVLRDFFEGDFLLGNPDQPLQSRIGGPEDMPWALVETMTYGSGEAPALQLRFVKRMAGGRDLHSAVLPPRELPFQADPKLDWMQQRLSTSSVYKPSFFKAQPHSALCRDGGSQEAASRQRETSSLLQKESIDQLQHGVRGGARQEEVVSRLGGSRKLLQYDSVGMHECFEQHQVRAQQQAPSNKRPAHISEMDEIFKLPCLPSAGQVPLLALNGGGDKGKARCRQSPRFVSAASPRSDSGWDTSAQDLRSGKMTPRTQKEADSSAARVAQRKNMVMQHVNRLQNKDWASRKVAVDALASFVEADPTVLEYVMVLLDSRKDRCRQTAVWAISRIVDKGDPGAVELLLIRLESRSMEVRMAALSALRHIAVKGDRRTILGVLKRFKHADWNVREAAVDALQHVADQGDPYALEELAECVRGDPDWRVRQVAMEQLEVLLDGSMTSVRIALECFAAACADVSDIDKARPLAAPLLSTSSYRSVLRSVCVPAAQGVCPQCRGVCGAGLDERFNCQECVSGVRTWFSTKFLQKSAVAFVMGGHARLGARSWVRVLDPELLPLILEHVS